MPTLAATITKAAARQALSRAVGDWHQYTTSSAGNAGGTTAVVAALSGIGAEYVIGGATPMWLLPTTGGSASDYRRVTDFATTTITVATAFTGQIANSTTVELHQYRPDLYTEAFNRAVQKLWQYRRVYRLVGGHVITNAERPELQGNRYYSMPRGIRTVGRMSYMGSLELRDLFDRADSTTDAGNSWTATSATWGISSEELYSVTDTDGNLLTRDVTLKDGIIQMTVRGTLNSATTYRVPALVFRIMEDRTGAIPAAASRDYLVVRLQNALVDLRKVDGGTETSLTTTATTTTNGTNYVLRVQFVGANIRVWVDDVELINYNLVGLNLKYLQYPRFGIRWDLAGAPATAARVDSFYAFQAGSPIVWPDWDEDADSLALRIPAYGNRAPSGILYVEGQEMLTQFADDTNLALVNDTTAILEIATTDPAWRTLIEQAKAELYRMLGSEITPQGIPQNAQDYANKALEAEANVGRMPKMPIVNNAPRRMY